MSVTLRSATDDDLDFYLEVRNDPKVYPGFYSQKEPIKYIDHVYWWCSRPSSWYKFIIEKIDAEIVSDSVVMASDPYPIGILNIGQCEHWSPEIGYALKSEYHGHGYGTEAVRNALNWLKLRGYEYTHTTVLENNERSLKLLKRLGFEVLGKARENELWLTKHLGGQNE